jgi:hypothetical protein
MSKDTNVLPSTYPDRDRLRPVTYSKEELDEFTAEVAHPQELLAQYAKDMATSVFGHGFEVKDGKPVSQGIGAPGHETLNHFNALKLAEDNGTEAKGTWANAVRDFWRREPERAEKMRLPRPEALGKLNPL